MRFVLIAVIAALTGCSTPATKMGQVRVGMTRAEVISVLGHPISTGESDGQEYLYYKMAENISDYSHSFWGGQPYYVRLKDGRVDAYGRQGGSTK